MSFERPAHRNSLLAAFAAIATLGAGNAEAQSADTNQSVTEINCRLITEKMAAVLRSGRMLTKEEMAEARQCPDLPEIPFSASSTESNNDSATTVPPETRRDREKRPREQTTRPH